MSYASVAPSVAMRRSRRSASVRNLPASTSRTVEYFFELVVRDRDRQPRLTGGTVFDSTQRDIEVAASGSGVEAGESDLKEPWLAPESFGEKSRDLDFESDDAGGIAWVGLDKRRATFGIATPQQLARLLGDNSD